MSKLIEIFREIWRIKELRQRLLITLGLIAVYRVGSYILLPGIDATKLEALASQASTGLLGLINLFAGGGFARSSIFALGVMPYITASIIVQLLGVSFPYFQRLQQEGESGRRKLNQITRYLTVLITAIQASAYVTYLRFIAADAIIVPPGLFWFTTVVILTAGTLFAMWIGEKITDRGVGNGISLLITVGILADLPFALTAEVSSRLTQPGGQLYLLLELLILVGVVVGVIMIVQAVRKIPIQYTRRVIGGRIYQVQGARQYLPFKVTAAGVMPIIFAQAIMMLPSTVAQFFGDAPIAQTINQIFGDIASFWYNLFLFILVVIFTYFYTAVIYNPIQMAEDMKRNGAFIPGVKPGRKTAEYIDRVITHITFPGAILIGIVAILPAFAILAGVNQQFAQFYGGTTLLIIVAVLIEFLQHVESYMLMRHYEGLMRTGRLQRRRPIGVTA